MSFSSPWCWWSVKYVQCGFSGVCGSRSYPFYHPFSPIREDPCHHYTYSNDTNTWVRQTLDWCGFKKERLNDRNKSGLRGQVGLTDVCNKTVWNSLIKSNFTKWYSVTVYRCDLCIRNGCQKLYRGDNVPRDVIELNLESCGAVARCHTE